MSELQRLKSLLPPENESWVFIEAAAAIDPPLITLEEIGRDEVEIQIDLDEWDNFAIDHRNLLFWHEVGKIQNDTIPSDGWEMAALAAISQPSLGIVSFWILPTSCQNNRFL